MVLSPITETSNTKLQRKIQCRLIIENYKKINVDVSKFFIGLDEISVYQCLDTGYLFFYPLNINGDSSFYGQLQELDWYYMPWKWEHDQASQYVKEGMNILEVGCGQGEFLQGILRLVHAENLIGLELNESAVKKGKGRKLAIINESVETHSKKFPAAYDLVCSFQVLEHISHVKDFLESQLTCLKVGGILIISVPNNSGFLVDSDNLLNTPPHHMGLWEEKTLLALQAFFPMVHIATIEALCTIEGHGQNYFFKRINFQDFE